MFEEKSFFEVLQLGGFTMYVLVLCSFISITVIIERIVFYRKVMKTRRDHFLPRVKSALEGGSASFVMQLLKETNSPYSRIVLAGLLAGDRPEKEISGAMERQISQEASRLEEYTGIVGTIGNIAVYIGLFGTVLGIIRAFRDIAVAGSGGMTVVIGGVAEALVCTATGLLVAIPAVIAYNYFMRKINKISTDMELCASEALELIRNRTVDLSGVGAR